MIPSEKVYFGGGINTLERTIQPTVLHGVEFKDKVKNAVREKDDHKYKIETRKKWQIDLSCIIEINVWTH